MQKERRGEVDGDEPPAARGGHRGRRQEARGRRSWGDLDGGGGASKTEQQRDGGGKVGWTAQGSSQTANSASARLPPSLVVVAAHTRHSSTCTVAAARGLGQSASRAWARPLAAC